jgi:hypothetical protein
MARAMARQVVPDVPRALPLPRSWKNPEDYWPEEPTAVDSALTMEELIVEELGRATGAGDPANDPKQPKKGTLLR